MRLPLLLCGALAGCAEPPARMCTQEANAGITVHLLDAASGQYLRRDAHGVAREGSYADSTSGDLGILGFAVERPGSYDLRVRAEGYQPWDSAGVRVLPGECHVRSVVLRIRLRQA